MATEAVETGKIFQKGINFFCLFSLVVLTGLTAFGASYYLETGFYEMFRNILVTTGLSLLIVFCFVSGVQKGTFCFDNADHPFRFLVVYVTAIVCTVIFAKLPVTGWLFLVFYVCLTQVSDTVTGMVSATTLLILTVFLCPADGTIGLYLYLLSGLSGIAFFSRIGKDFKIGFPLAFSLVTQLIFLMSGVLLVQNKRLGPEDTVIPMVNIVVSGIVICIYMQFYNTKVANKESILYQTINDPEYEKMLSLKEKSRVSYYRSLHTAYLTERICTKLMLDVQAAKCAAYYHHFSMDELNEMDIPVHGRRLIEQLKKKVPYPMEKEAVVVSICDALITTIQYLSGQAKDQKIQYELVIHKLFQKRLSPETFLESEITLRDMRFIEQKLIEEKMYYDFVC